MISISIARSCSSNRFDSLTQQRQETDHRPHARLGRSSLHFFLHSIMTSGAFPTANRESAFTLSTSQTRPQPLQTPTRQWDLFCHPLVSGEPTDPILPDSDPFLPKGHPVPTKNSVLTELVEFRRPSL